MRAHWDVRLSSAPTSSATSTGTVSVRLSSATSTGVRLSSAAPSAAPAGRLSSVPPPGVRLSSAAPPGVRLSSAAPPGGIYDSKSFVVVLIAVPRDVGCPCLDFGII